MKKYKILLVILLAIFLTSCDKFLGVNEGVIEYDVTFLDSEKKEKPVIGLLPTEMKIIFKDGSSKSKIEGFMGMFLTAYISNTKNKTNTILFKVMSDKNCTVTPFGEKTLGFDDAPGIHIEKTKETKEIAGYKAKKAHVTFDDKSIESFDIYYTEKIKIENPNWNNPYKEINGVLLEFKIKMKGITMNVKAREVKKEAVDDSEFDIPEGFKKVTPDKLNVIIDQIMNSANQ